MYAHYAIETILRKTLEKNIWRYKFSQTNPNQDWPHQAMCDNQIWSTNITKLCEAAIASLCLNNLLHHRFSAYHNLTSSEFIKMNR